MIICNNLNKNFPNNSIIYVDCQVQITKRIELTNLVIFADDNNKINSINLLDNSILNIDNDKKYFTLDDNQISILIENLKQEHLIIENKPKLIYGTIIQRTKHPKSDNLFILSIDINKNEPIQIVTNTLDSQENKTLVLALPGTVVFNGSEILKNKVMDVDSYGMLTGYKTLGIDKEGLIFGDSSEKGKDFKF
ncbi:hypothetical protein NW739_02470 [Mycoplasmopsis felis]|uniref:TyrS-associated PheT N-terminal domain-related protein TapR n=1 Tax=Mycoplasmopsis felis TaxID=33923 RepID=UPI0021E08C9B|nr:hypothetical protein [Mycoplasmopsis felis]MCU9934046.1 hypothetical protein [Mycoplasmopsis felis]MCU9938798.1 hypothetical protein [Mycoplasmopsis felis]MCU9939642.1 hypothetical protein [Mycoplasmopsis felis]WAM01232.1 hypothetical protein NWE60_00985 [Mycoplasmopsis felis]WQQ08752.1 hypothetical protein RRG61_01385 [Mycoplasmopsis felis]